MNSEVAVNTQKAAYDAVDGMRKITAREIKAVASQYGKMMGKDRRKRIAGVNLLYFLYNFFCLKISSRREVITRSLHAGE